MATLIKGHDSTAKDTMLPPPPWTAKGKRVVDGAGRVVCDCSGARFPEETARMIAQWPEMAEQLADFYAREEGVDDEE